MYKKNFIWWCRNICIVVLVYLTNGFIKGTFQKNDSVLLVVNIILCILLIIYIYYNKYKLNINRISLFILGFISLLIISILMREMFIKFINNSFGKDINILIEICVFVIVYLLASKNYFIKKENKN